MIFLKTVIFSYNYVSQIIIRRINILIQNIFLNNGLTKNQFAIKAQKNPKNADNTDSQLVIEIDKTKQN